MYEVWDKETRNLLGAFPAEAEALRLVRDVASANGAEAGAALELAAEDEAGETHTLLDGPALLRRALTAAPADAAA